MRKIIVGVDDSHRSSDAIALASRLARLTGSTLLLVNVLPRHHHPSPRGHRRSSRAPAQPPWRRERGAQDDRRWLARPRAPRARPAGGCRLGGGGRGATHVGRAGRVLPGSTVERLLHGSPCPVAVAPKGYSAAIERRTRHHRLRLRRLTLRCPRARDRPPRLEVTGARLRAIRAFAPLALDTRPTACCWAVWPRTTTRCTSAPRASSRTRSRRSTPNWGPGPNSGSATRCRPSPWHRSSSTCWSSARAATGRCTPSWSEALPGVWYATRLAL
jgi:hypothetical protein